MVITPTKPSSFQARIPSDPDPDRIVEPNIDTLVVAYESDGTIRLNREPETGTVENMSNISTRLRQIFELREGNFNHERTVFIKAPKGLDYGNVVSMIDAVKAGGAEPISLQIDGIE